MGVPTEFHHTSSDGGRNIEKSAHNIEIDAFSEADSDVAALARLGKKPILKVGTVP